MRRAKSLRRDSRGFTLIEVLAAVAILAMLTLVVNSGLTMATKSYAKSVAMSEAETLLSSLSKALSNELRYATFDDYVYANTAGDSGDPIIVMTRGGAAENPQRVMRYLIRGRWGKGGLADAKSVMFIDSRGVLRLGMEGDTTNSSYYVISSADYGRQNIKNAVYGIRYIAIYNVGRMFKYEIMVDRGTGGSSMITGAVENLPHG